MPISYTKSFNIPVSIPCAALAHIINVYEICLNTTNYPIFNMQGFIYCLWTSILKLFWSAGIPTMMMADSHSMFIYLCVIPRQSLCIRNPSISRIKETSNQNDNSGVYIFPLTSDVVRCQ